jgi:molybdopterin-guanine dinucleotide biosynthesis protein A
VRHAAVTGIVLAGGRSARFGGDKLAVDVGGQPLVHRAICAIAEVADEVVVVVGPGALAPALPGDLPVPVVIARDSVVDRGPLAGLAAGLAAASRPHALLVAGDQPWLHVGVLGALLDELGGESRGAEPDVVALEDGNRLWPFPVALRVATVRPAAEAGLEGPDLRLFTLFGRLRIARVPEARWRALDPAGDSLRDVDTPRDLPTT